MKPFIPHPFAKPSPPIQVMTMATQETISGDLGGDVCRSMYDRGHFATDVVTAFSSRWLAWAVSEALSGRVPRTKCYLVPVLTGGGEWSHGRGSHALPMAFGGADCWPAWPDGAACDDPDPAVLPEHEGLAPRRRVVVEEVLLDDFESMDWPAIRAPGGVA